MRRIKLTVEYDGSALIGWQRQDSPDNSVQQILEEAIQELTGELVNLHVAGRTDAGVHARGQVCHFDISCADDKNKWKLIRFQDGVNRFLPETVSVVEAEDVSKGMDSQDGFHARFSAVAREYEFLIFNRRSPSPLWENRAVHIIQSLDIELMRREAECLIGEHDFSAFRSSDCGAKSPISTMEFFRIIQDGDLIRIQIKANRFLHNMVRIMVGTLVDVGRGKLEAGIMQKMLADTSGQSRCQGGQTIAPYGLYFVKAYYL